MSPLVVDELDAVIVCRRRANVELYKGQRVEYDEHEDAGATAGTNKLSCKLIIIGAVERVTAVERDGVILVPCRPLRALPLLSPIPILFTAAATAIAEV